MSFSFRWFRTGVRAAACSCVVLAALPWQPSCLAEARRAVWCAGELRQGLLTLNSRITAFRIEYESMPNSLGVTPGLTVHRVVAARGPSDFFESASHGTIRFKWPDDPKQQEIAIHGRREINQFPFDRKYRETLLPSPTNLPGSYTAEITFLVFGWWPLDGLVPPTLGGGAPEVLPAVAHSADYGVAPDQELLDGRWCHVFQFPGHDRLWLDTERTCLPLARETYDLKTGRRLQRIEARRVREVRPGIWAPMEFRAVRYDADSQAPFVDAVTQILDVKLNEEVPTSTFECVLRPGSIQVYDDRHVEQAVPGGASEYLGFLAEWIRFHPRPNEHSTQYPVVLGAEAALEYGLSIVSLVMLVWWWRLSLRVRRTDCQNVRGLK